MKTRRPSVLRVFIDLFVDLLLIGVGYALYHHFMIAPLAPFTLHPFLIQILGGDRHMVSLAFAGVFFISGLLGLARTILLILRGAKARPKELS